MRTSLQTLGVNKVTNQHDSVGGPKTTHKETCDASFGPSISFELQPVIISATIWVLMVFQVQKSIWLSHCESFVVNKGFRQGLNVTVIFYTVHNTKTQPRVRKKRNCIYAILLRLNLGYDTTKIILVSSL